MDIDTDALTGMHYAAMALAGISGIVHLVLGISFLPHWMGFSFLVATGGFAAGIVAIATNQYRGETYLLGIPFILGQIVLWIALTHPEFVSNPGAIATIGPVEAIDKLVQIALIAVLVVLLQSE